MQQICANSFFAAASFAAKPGATNLLIKSALPLIAERPNARMLDLGCGAGAIAVSAALTRSDLAVTAVDVSFANIATANKAADAAGVGDRVKTVCGNYFSMPPANYDLIISDSVIQLIEGSDDELAARIASDLTEGGMLVAVMPTHSFGNWLHVLLRRVWRMLPTACDRIVLVIAKCVYPHIPSEVLRDRIPYLRVLPIRLFGTGMAAAFERHRLDVVQTRSWPTDSVAKLKHKLIVWRRRG